MIGVVFQVLLALVAVLHSLSTNWQVCFFLIFFAGSLPAMPAMAARSTAAAVSLVVAFVVAAAAAALTTGCGCAAAASALAPGQCFPVALARAR